MPLTMRRVLLVCLLALCTAPVAARRQAPKAEFIWTGTGTVSHAFYPGRAFDPTEWSGSVRDDRTVQLRVRETQHKDVVDEQGRLIGQITFLADNGSTWTGSVNHGETHLGNIRIAGAGGGSGKVSVAGVMYRSAVTPNPLADVLADGAYFMQAEFDAPIKYTQTITEPNRKPEVSSEQSTSSLSTGDARLGYWLTTTPSPATAASVRASLARPPVPGVYIVDAPRTLVNGRMAGNYSKELTGDSKGQMLTADWSLTRTTNVRITLTEAPPDWRPERNNFTTVTATVDPALGIKGHFRFTLFDVSSEPGFAMNAGTDTGLDLQFPSSHPQPMVTPDPANPLVIQTTTEGVSATANIEVLDTGAWGRIKAEFFIGGDWVTAETSRGQRFASIPLDEDGDHIADEWADYMGVNGQPVTSDNDRGPTGANNGDGFSNYEEYRGFVVDGEWTSTDPVWKDLFINNEVTADCGDFPSTSIHCHIIRPDEFDADRVVNFRRHYGTAGPQKGLLIVAGSLAIGPDGRERVGVLGETTLAIPNEGTPITLDTGYLAHFNALGVSETGTMTPFNVAQSSVVAHEIGHAVNIDHHGTNESAGACGDTGVVGSVAVWGGAYSGDRECFMSYARPMKYQRLDGSCHDWPWPHQWGKTICTSKEGTGLNAGPERLDSVTGKPLPASGNATNGNCERQLRLKR
jgi:hypothetical protein